MRKFFSKKKLQGSALPAPIRDRACYAPLQAIMHYMPFHVEHIFYACSTSLQALMHYMPFHVEHIFYACSASLQALMHSVPQPAPLRDRACSASLQALMHSVPQPAPLRAPPIALRLAGVTRPKITPAFAGAMRMSAKPPLSLPWRGLSPRGRDTPAPLWAGHAGARPGGGTPLRRQRHYAHERLPLRSTCTIAPFRRQSIAWKSAHIPKIPYLRRVQHVACVALDCQTIKKSLLWQYFKTCGSEEQKRSSEARCCTPRVGAPCRGNWLPK